MKTKLLFMTFRNYNASRWSMAALRNLPSHLHLAPNKKRPSHEVKTKNPASECFYHNHT